MIVIENGIVKVLSNDSSHYQPGKEYLLKLYTALRQQGVLLANATIHVFGNEGEWRLSGLEFWRDWWKL
jgi:hypothetical protein